MMPSPTFLTNATTADGFLLVLAIVLPVIGILLLFACGGRYVERIVLFLIPVGLGVAAAVFAAVWRSSRPLTYIVGGWQPPLGIALRADGLSAAMMITVAVVIGATALFAREEFGQSRQRPEARAPLVFWILLLAIWAALNIIVVSDDLFNLYVALELLTFAAVPLVCLKGYEETIKAALRYLLFALFGSVLYLFGTVIIYGAYGTLDIALLAERVRPEPVAWIAAALMTMGLLAKTALFPFHLWLPPAHAGAPAPGSAVLSALVVKGSFFLIVRLWFDAMPGLMTFAATQMLATLGAEQFFLEAFWHCANSVSSS
jgi:formate hydrogenlyase subunit 3/multisubunit Na+/H+ antiporter MnhD subunit